MTRQPSLPNPPARRQAIGVVRRDGGADLARFRTIATAVVLTALVLALAAARDAHGATYKWVDDKGIIHYADKMPTEAVNRGHSELDKQGILIRKTEAPLTPEQMRAKVAEIERQKKAAKENEELVRRDRALLASYTREEDIDLSRARALTTIEGQMQSARVYGATLAKRQKELVEKKQAFGDGVVPPAIDRELESVEGELSKNNALMAAKKEEALGVAGKYDVEKQRWRDLKAAADVAAARNAPGYGTATFGVLPTASMK